MFSNIYIILRDFFFYEIGRRGMREGDNYDNLIVNVTFLFFLNFIEISSFGVRFNYKRMSCGSDRASQ